MRNPTPQGVFLLQKIFFLSFFKNVKTFGSFVFGSHRASASGTSRKTGAHFNLTIIGGNYG